MITVRKLTGARYFDGSYEVDSEKTFKNEKEAMKYIDQFGFDAQIEIKDDCIGSLADGSEFYPYRIWREALEYRNIK